MISPLLVLTIPLAAASDHIDGVPSLERHEQVDLTDLYVFEVPTAPERLAVVLDLYPGVDDSGHFSSKVGYRIKVRPVEPDRSAPHAAFATDAGAEVEIRCGFTDPAHHRAATQPATTRCALHRAGAVVAAAEGTTGAVLHAPEGGLRVYSGARADPFFLNPASFRAVTEREGFVPVAAGSAGNIMAATNVLTIAVEIDKSLLLPPASGSLVAVVAESFATDGGSEEVLDRLGRGELTNLSLHAHGDAEPLKMPYNAVGAFEAPPAVLRTSLEARLRDNIGAYDRYDSAVAWDDGALGGLVSLLLEDYLVVDLSSACSHDAEGDFFSIERAQMTGSGQRPCGGRRIADDVFASLYALYIGGPTASVAAYETGASAPYQGSDRRLSSALPYLDEPYPTGFPRVNLRRFTLRLLKRDQD